MVLSILLLNSCCLGVLVKSESTDRSLRGHEEWLSICGKRLLSSSPNKMENNNNMIRSPEVHLSSCSSSVDEENKFLQENGNSSSFINKAAIAWNEMRREWVGDRSKRSHSRLREPIISWSATYDDLLSVGQPFPQPIPLSEMVDFLVDIWNEEGLYD